MLGMDREDSNTSMCILKLHVFKCFVIAVLHVDVFDAVFELPLNKCPNSFGTTQ